jgi:thymidylate kinase
MAYLQSRSTEADITHYGNMLWGPEAWAKAAPGLNSGEWATQKGLKALCAVLDPILQRSRRSLPVAYLRRLGMSVLKKATRLRQRIDQTTPLRMRMQGPAPIIAFVGSDGAGKSTVTADLRKWLSWKTDCHTVYFGSKDESFRTAQRLVARFRKKKSPRRHGASEAKPKKPSFWQAFRAAHAAYLRLRNQRWAERMTARGQIVIADRLPQFEVAGIYDGPSGIDPRQAPLLARPFYWYEARATARLAGLRPNLIVRMTVPFDVAVARKPDHDRAMLEQKIALTESLSFGNARSVRIDCTQPLDQVLLQVRAIAWAEIQAAAGSERR